MAYLSTFDGFIIDPASGDSDIGLGYKSCGNLHYNGTCSKNENSGKWEYASKIISSDTIMQRRECLVGVNRTTTVNFSEWNFDKLLCFCIALGCDYLQGG